MFEKQIKKLENSGYTVEVFKEIRKDRLSSFWYKWEIAKISKGGQTKTLVSYREVHEKLIGKTKDVYFDYDSSNDKDIEKFYLIWGGSYHINDFIYRTYFLVMYKWLYEDNKVIDNPEDFFNTSMFSFN